MIAGQGFGTMSVLEGKTAIVTGAARGIRRATAELLAENGAAAVEELGRLDIVVNNAGCTWDGSSTR